jgi:hypothetical protein
MRGALNHYLQLRRKRCNKRADKLVNLLHKKIQCKYCHLHE